MEGKYIYCIISENEPKSLDVTGISSQQVRTLPYRDIAAVVSDTPVISFDRLDKKELTKHVAIHQKVNEAVMKLYDVVPMTFGIIAPGASEALRILEKAYLQFKTALKTIEGKVEFAVHIWWDQKKLLKKLVSTNPEIQQLKRKMSLKKAVLSMPIRLKIGRLLHQEVELRKNSYLKDIENFLKKSSYDSTSNKLIDDEMLANFSFLIQKTGESELDRKMQELGKRYEEKLRFKYIGPMPPYSFSNINLSLDNFEAVNRARELLELREEASFDEIKKAYYTLAHKYHPDKQGGEEEQMKKISQAYSILESYCQDGGKKENQKYSFKEEDVKNSIIIK